ncbi:hypothetical protein PLICRDRAFT_148005 [Plicaturopsis crispa FD-325 SS-3]|uniref:Unplaced genomic scaffold PLICRscaffold_22, whole genome shotgun sequence n=1 Tax=Plicaturopsis crispa FD-325 SS-3 TaxID=944288 RepID=A0A0C9SWC9_PLICR|nr:hypothetical protein PLICRDRAFT_148005 [Plicaturopsis crispa FD-325 SS-3]
MDTVVLVALGLCLVTALSLAFTRRKHAAYPPGPPMRPLIGNILRVPAKHPWLGFTELKETYGDLVYFKGLGNSVLVLNTLKAVNDLLERRGNIYSHRPILTMVGELMGLTHGMVMMPANKTWAMHRKFARIALNPEAVKKYHPLQEDLATVLVKDIIATPEDFILHIRRASGRIVMSVTYGLPVDASYDEYVADAELAMEIICQAMAPGAHIVDIIPALKHLPRWLPFIKFHQHGDYGRQAILDSIEKPFNRVKEELKAGTARPSIVSSLLEDTDVNSEDNFQETVQWIAGVLYGAGGETVFTTVEVFMLLMARYPEKQRKAQAEIDSVVGADRLPTIADRPDLPYVEALIKETMRWYPAVPLSIARRTAEDDVYQGYLIPKGTVVFPNVWAISHDAANSKHDPADFVPERFLDDEGEVNPANYAFGFGRRLCPGKHLAENSVFIFVASILSCLDVSPPKDAHGNELPVEVTYTTGLVSCPENFRVDTVPRPSAKAKLAHYI